MTPQTIETIFVGVGIDPVVAKLLAQTDKAPASSFYSVDVTARRYIEDNVMQSKMTATIETALLWLEDNVTPGASRCARVLKPHCNNI